MKTLNKPEGSGDVVKVDSSRYAHLTSDGMTWPQDGDRWVTRIDNTGSWFRFDKTQQRIEMLQPDPDKCLIDMPRLLKNLFTTALEEAGHVQLHSSVRAGRRSGRVDSGGHVAGKDNLADGAVVQVRHPSTQL